MKAGFVVLVGRSNVGKSTLLNSLVGAKVAITSDKPQTTRFPIHGVIHEARGEIVFVDTPGVFEKPRDRVTRALNEHARAALEGIDALVYVADPTRYIGEEEETILKLVRPLTIPKILAINKIDSPKAAHLDDYRKLAPQFLTTIEISATHGTHLKKLVAAIFEHLPEGAPTYSEFQRTNTETRLWVSEVIREKVFLQMEKEIPYGVAVEVKEMEEREKKTGERVLYIAAEILTTHPNHKKMLIGKEGRKIKELGEAARKELELALQSKVFLDLEVVVDPRWPARLL
ncbi:GTPase Era [Candidatus Uhrbacteria bacterium]|nr:GTPase Era [Candidatus Uhrbacteria bacterium]